MLNKAIVIGHVGKDPDIRAMSGGSKMASFSIATTEKWKDKGTGERREKTEWHRVVCFDETKVDVIAKGVRKGSRIYVEGKMQTRKYQDKDGIERYTTEIVLTGFTAQIQLLDKSEGYGAPPPTGQDDYGTEKKPAPPRTPRNDLDDPIPF